MPAAATAPAIGARHNMDERSFMSSGLPKIVAGKLKRDAQESAGRSDDVHAKRVNDARVQLDEAERALRDDDTIVLDIPDTSVPAGRTVFRGDGLQVSRGGRKLFADNGVDLTIRGPERIARSIFTARTTSSSDLPGVSPVGSAIPLPTL